MYFLGLFWLSLIRLRILWEYRCRGLSGANCNLGITKLALFVSHFGKVSYLCSRKTAQYCTNRAICG